MNRYAAIPAHDLSYTAWQQCASNHGKLLPLLRPCCTSCRVPARVCCPTSSCNSMAHDGTRGDIPQDRSGCCRTGCDKAPDTDLRHLFPWMNGRNRYPWHQPCDNTQGTIPEDIR